MSEEIQERSQKRIVRFALIVPFFILIVCVAAILEACEEVPINWVWLIQCLVLALIPTFIIVVMLGRNSTRFRKLYGTKVWQLILYGIVGIYFVTRITLWLLEK